MNGLDLVLLLLLGVMLFRGYRRGALSLIGSFAGGLAGLVVGAAFAPDVAALFISEPGMGLALTTLAVVLLALFVGHALGLAVGHRLRAAVAVAGAAPADRVAGMAVAVGGLLLGVWLIGSFMSQGPMALVADQFRESRIVQGVDRLMPPAPDMIGRAGAYLDQRGFPQAFADLSDPVAPPVDPPSEGAVASAAQAGSPSTVRIEATGCGAASLGSGFVTSEQFVVTNAHVVAGAQEIRVRDQDGGSEAVAVHVDPEVDLAVLRVEGLSAPAIAWVDEPAERGSTGATLGFPGQGSTMQVRAAAVRRRGEALGRDIYGAGGVSREILTVSAPVERGDSGGPFVTSEGRVAGVVFAASRSEAATGYVLTAESVQDDVSEAISRNAASDTGQCRF